MKGTPTGRPFDVIRVPCKIGASDEFSRERSFALDGVHGVVSVETSEFGVSECPTLPPKSQIFSMIYESSTNRTEDRKGWIGKEVNTHMFPSFIGHAFHLVKIVFV